MLERVTRNWPLKLLAVGLAFAVWVAVTGENRIVADLKVPVNVVLPPGRFLARPAPPTVGVELRGAETVLRGIDSTDLSLRLDLRGAPAGTREVELGAGALTGVPRGVDVVQFDPERLALEIAEGERRSVPVSPSFVNEPPHGYALYGARVVPESVGVEGPGGDVAKLSRLRTDPIHLEGRTQPFTVRVGVVSDRPSVRVLDPGPVEVRALVDAAPVEVTLDEVPVVIAGQLAGASAAPASVRVTLSGPPAVLSAIGPGQVRAVVDVSSLEPRAEPYRLSLRAEILRVSPDDLARVTVKSISRSSVEVTVPDRRTPR